MDLRELYTKIELPTQVCQVIEQIQTTVPPEVLYALTAKQSAGEAYRWLAGKTSPLNHGLDLLAWMLQAALYTYDTYAARGIPEILYFDTMKCFTRFINEYKSSYGVYGFDRGFWVYRQLSLTLFRVGELEYEFIENPQGISLHIPSDADISLEQCRRSLTLFDDFCEEFFPQKANRPILLNSWLLSPALQELLPPSSKIVRFQNCFYRTAWDEEDGGFFQWIYGRGDMALCDLPEDTRLQKNVKRHLLQGKKIGAAGGVLKSFEDGSVNRQSCFGG